MTASVQIIGSRAGGGAEGFYCRLTNALAASGERTWAMLPPGSVLNAELSGSVIRVPRRMRGVWDLPARYAILSWVRRHAPPVVQTWMGRATRLTRLPGNSPSVHVARLGGFYDVRGYAHADALVGNTRGICDYLIAAGIAAKRVHYISNFVAPARPVDAGEIQALRASLAIDTDAWVILTTGRFHPNKGLPDLLDAIERMPLEVGGRPLVFVLVGAGPLEAELRGQAQRLGIEERLRWAGWQTDTAPYYALADAFVCPSRHEPLGNVVLEAWMHRLPLIATRSQGPLELVDHEVDGRLVDVQDPPALAQAIVEVMSATEDERARLADAGHQKVTQRFGRDRIVTEYLALYETLAR